MTIRSWLVVVALSAALLPEYTTAAHPSDVAAQFRHLSLAEKLALAEEYGVSVEDMRAEILSEMDQRSSDGNVNSVSILHQNGISQSPEEPSSAKESDADFLSKKSTNQTVPVGVKDNSEGESELPETSRVKNTDLWGELKRFGADIFDQSVSSFAVTDNWPVSDSYLVGVGDELRIQLIGKEVNKLVFTVGRDGGIVFPRIGEINVAGMNFPEVKALIAQKVANAFIGTHAVTTLGPLRKINVFAAGSVKSPGNYAVLNSITLTQMLFVVGGPNELGTMRNIQIHRGGKLLAAVDLYDLLLSGTLEDDIRLRNGDVLFVPTAGPLIGVKGQVRRPAVYELREEETLQDAISMADGLLFNAMMDSATLRRRMPDSELPVLLNFNLRNAEALDVPVFPGDLLTISKVPDRYENPVSVMGAVEFPGLFAWYSGLRVSDLIPSVEGRLTEGADLDVALLVRRRSDRQSIDVLSFGLEEAVKNPGSEFDPLLSPHDEIIVFDRSKSRSAMVKETIAKLELQSTVIDRPRFVEIRGAVSDPGKFPLLVNQRVSDLLALAGGMNYLSLDVDMDIAVIVRRDAVSVKKYEAIPFRLDDALTQRYTEKDPVLMPMDELLILSETDGEGMSNRREVLQSVVDRFERQATLNERAQIVQVLGEVREPGRYPILNTLSIEHLIELAGGFSEGAYTQTAEIHRTRLSDDETLTTEVLTISLQNDDVQAQVLHSRDVLRVNKNPGWQKVKLATVSGEVKFPGTYPLRQGERLTELLSRAGGVTSDGFVAGAIYTNERALQQQRFRSEQYFTNLSKSSLILDLSGVDKFESIQALQHTVESELTGRVTVDLAGALQGEDVMDPLLQDGDSLHIPLKVYQISVVGEVFLPGDFSFSPRLKIKDYIELAGGATRFSETRRVYVIKADGGVVFAGKKGLFRNRFQPVEIEAGDTIVVPVNLTYETGIKRVGTFSKIAFETLGSIAALLNISKL